MNIAKLYFVHAILREAQLVDYESTHGALELVYSFNCTVLSDSM